MPPPGRPDRRSALLAAALFVAALAVFATAGRNGFVNYDDDELLLANAPVRAGLGAGSLAFAFDLSEFPNWHPLTWLSHMADFSLFGTWAGGHHLVGALLHAAGAAVLVLALAAATGAPGRSAAAATLFALHPLRVESVAWASERKDVLALLFVALALLAWVRHLRQPRASAFAATLALYACALMSKPTAVVFPLLLLVLDGWPLGRWRAAPGAGPAAARRLLLEKLPFAALAALAAALTLAAQRGSGAVAYLADYPAGQRAANALRSCGLYLAKTLWPADLAAFYPYFWEDVPWWQPALGAAAVAALSLAAVRAARRHPAALAGWTWYLVALFPVIGIVQAGSQALADRYTHLAHVGLFVAVAWPAGAALARRPRLRAPAAAAGAAVAAALAAASVAQVAVWHDTETLFRHALAVTRENFVAASNLGTWLVGQGRVAEGNELIARAYRSNPYFRGDAFTKAGDYYTRRGMHREAAGQYRKALGLAPHDERVAGRLREALARAGPGAPPGGVPPDPHATRGATAAARPPAGAAPAAAPAADPARAAHERALALARAGRREEAATALRETLRLDPSRAGAWSDLGAALGELGRLEEAEAALREALRLDPRHGAASANLAAVRELRARRGR